MTIRQEFPEIVTQLTLNRLTYSGKDSNGVISSPSVVTSQVYASLQSNYSNRNLSISGLETDGYRIYIDTPDLGVTTGVYLSDASRDYLIGDGHNDVVGLGLFTKVAAYCLEWVTLTWNYEVTGTIVDGVWIDGIIAGTSTKIHIWDPSVSPSTFSSVFISTFDFQKNMLLAVTHPTSAVPPQGSITRLNGTDLVLVHISEERHHSGGHILVLRRNT